MADLGASDTGEAVQAFRARRVLTFAGEGPARGLQELCRPLPWQDDMLILTAGGRIAAVEPYRQRAVPLGCKVTDLGEAALIPALVNAHCHLQLGHLAGRTLWGKGFVPWLASLIPLLQEPLQDRVLQKDAAALAACGTGMLGDFVSHGMGLTAAAALSAGVCYTGFCEWFGFIAPFIDAARPWPPRCRQFLPQAWETAGTYWYPCGHALYSTHADVLQDAHAHCMRSGGVFALHLAEFYEETQALTRGDGALVELYTPVVLPPDWQAPGVAPVALAAKLGLLGKHTLAVHAVHCDAADQRLLAESDTAICLCPRSNANLAVGTAPVWEYMHCGILLCLGTDGVSSNTDLDVMQEARWLQERLDVPVPALLRMLTVNGAAALQRDGGRLIPGAPARWAVLPADWD